MGIKDKFDSIKDAVEEKVDDVLENTDIDDKIKEKAEDIKKKF